MNFRRPRFAKPSPSEGAGFRERNETPPLRETFAPEAKRYDATTVAIALGFGANAAMNFAIQAWMTYGFAREVWGIPSELCVALIVALDVFAILYMLLTFALRGTGWPRLAAMAVFLFAVGAQVFAAELYGDHKKWSTEVRWFAALPAVFLALSQEGVILWRTRKVDRASSVQSRKPQAAAGPERKAKPVAEPVVTLPPPSAPVAPAPTTRREPVKPPAAPRKTSGDSIDRDDIARRVIAGHLTKQEASRQTGKTVKSIENWMNALKAREGGTPEPHPGLPELTTFPLTSAPPADQRMNGAAPAVEVK